MYVDMYTTTYIRILFILSKYDDADDDDDDGKAKITKP